MSAVKFRNLALGVGTWAKPRRKRRKRVEMGRRRLSFESLEDRQMLAVFTVTNLNDAPVTGAGQAPGSLRQAIFDANATPAVADEIQFGAGLSGTIQLSHVANQVEGPSALVVSSTITIRGNTSGITIARAAAAPEMRLFRVTAAANLTLESLNLTNGLARGAAGIADGNGGDGRGGAVFNKGTLQIVASTLYNNFAIGGVAGAGGSSGPGVGGGIYSSEGALVVRNATFSGNQALNGELNTVHSAFGGGIYCVNSSLNVYNSTITQSTALSGRGIYFVAVGETAIAVIQSTIIAQADDAQFDLFASHDAGGTVDVNGANNLIRWLNDFQEIAIPEFIRPEPGDPRLSALVDNGGPTLTHALLGDSPAFSRGANPLNLATDQRGSTFARETGDGVDVGAFESSTVAPALPGDYNRDNFVNAADYVLWRKLVGSNVASFEFADGDGSGDVDQLDYDVWEENFGETLAESPPTHGAGIDVPVLIPVAPRFIAFDDREIPQRQSATLPMEVRPINDDTHDKALLALLTAWDGAVRGGREPLDFE